MEGGGDPARVDVAAIEKSLAETSKSLDEAEAVRRRFFVVVWTLAHHYAAFFLVQAIVQGLQNGQDKLLKAVDELQAEAAAMLEGDQISASVTSNAGASELLAHHEMVQSVVRALLNVGWAWLVVLMVGIGYLAVLDRRAHALVGSAKRSLTRTNELAGASIALGSSTWGPPINREEQRHQEGRRDQRKSRVITIVAVVVTIMGLIAGIATR